MIKQPAIVIIKPPKNEALNNNPIPAKAIPIPKVYLNILYMRLRLLKPSVPKDKFHINKKSVGLKPTPFKYRQALIRQIGIAHATA